MIPRRENLSIIWSSDHTYGKTYHISYTYMYGMFLITSELFVR
jgi:hypothetical protein